jgi:SAM-dependent methyltransferase
MLASLFSGPSRAFLSRFRADRCELALDLGCGTGHSTRLVAGALHPLQTIGLDTSPAALRAARSRTRNASVTFVHHDVTVTPFPAPRPDLIYSRFLLAHVPDPTGVVRRWFAELRPGGKLLLDEGSSVRTSLEPIGRYLEMVAALLEHRGTAVDIGGVLDSLGQLGGMAVRHPLSREVTFTPPANGVAAMFRANMDAWRDDPFIATHVGEAAVAWLETELEALARTRVRDGVAWDLKQIAFERR